MSQNRILGFIIALIGGGLALLSFFAMPFLSFGGLISFTGQQIASLASQFSQYSSSSINGQAFVVLWLAPVVSALILLVGGLQLRSSVQLSTRKMAAWWMIALAVVGLLVYVGIYIYASSQIPSSSSISITSLLGSGFWIYILSMVAVIVGSIIQLNMKLPTQAWQSPAQPWQPTQPPPASSQYPENQPYQQQWSQQPQSQQYPPAQQSPGSEPSQWPPASLNQ
jgi:hypothetical protein